VSYSPTRTCDIALLRSLFDVKWRKAINIASLRDWGAECINTAATPGNLLPLVLFTFKIAPSLV
jgi:hypothetical protein